MDNSFFVEPPKTLSTMEKVVAAPVVIEKETINRLRFPKTDVLPSPELRLRRKLALERALKLGNSFRRKVKIVFEDREGHKQVETTIWALTQNNVSLKGGRHIPVNRIHYVRAY